MNSQRLATILAAIATTALVQRTAHAQSTPANAPVVRVLDETETYLRLWTPQPSGGYEVRLNTIVYGVTGRADATRMDIKQGGRVLLSQRCAFGDRDGTAARLACETPDSNLLSATGELTIELHYIDDENDRTELLRTFVVQARRYPDWIRGDGRRITEWGGRYQLLMHDAIGTAWVWHENPGSRQTEALEPQHLRFFTAFAGNADRTRGSVYSLRCTVNGTRIPDVALERGAINDLTEVSERPNMQDTRTVRWYRTNFTAQTLWWGRRVNIPANGTGYNTANHTFLGEHQGAWSCDVRMDGQVLRTFIFSVGADGKVAQHAEQTGAQSYRQLGGLSLIDARIPNPSPGDEYIDPAAIRASFQFGQPRRQAAGSAAALTSLPAAAVGNANPTVVPGFGAGSAPAGRARGRRR